MSQMQYTDEMKKFILDNYKGTPTRELTEWFNARFGTNVTYEKIRAYKKNHNLSSGLNGRFAKGHVPANKGQKMSPELYEKVKHTMFRKGHRPKNYRLVGSERVNRDGYVEIKVEDPKKWRLKHMVVWEQHNGKIPKGYAVLFLDGDKQNLDITNLKLVKRSELLIMNRYNLYGADAQLTETATNLARLMDQTNVAKRKQKKDEGD